MALQLEGSSSCFCYLKKTCNGRVLEEQLRGNLNKLQSGILWLRQPEQLGHFTPGLSQAGR